MAARSKPDEVADEDLAAPDRPVRPIARAVVDRAHGRPLEAVLGEAGRQMGMVVLHARQLHAVELERERRGGVVGVQVVGEQLGAQREEALEVVDSLAVGDQRGYCSRSPMWWLTHARAPRATQNVALSWPPHASSGRRAATGSSMLAGT